MATSKTEHGNLSVDVDGVPYTGYLTIEDVGRGKVMFDVEFCDKEHHDKSCFRRGHIQVEIWSKIELTKLVRPWLAEHPEEVPA